MLGPALRMVTQLNVARAGTSAEVAAHAVVGDDAAHHVLDPDGVLGLDPLHATDLEAALPVLAARETGSNQTQVVVVKPQDDFMP